MDTSGHYPVDFNRELNILIMDNRNLPPSCPECGSTNVFDMDIYFECEDCNFTWD